MVFLAVALCDAASCPAACVHATTLSRVMQRVAFEVGRWAWEGQRGIGWAEVAGVCTSVGAGSEFTGGPPGLGSPVAGRVGVGVSVAGGWRLEGAGVVEPGFCDVAPGSVDEVVAISPVVVFCFFEAESSAGAD